MRKTILALFSTAVLLAGCKKDDLEETHENLVGPDGANTVVAMSMSFTHDGAAFDTSMVLTDVQGVRYKLEQLRFYMGHFDFTNDNHDSVASFPNKYLKVDLAEGGTIRNIGQLSGHLHDMSFGLGVDSVNNHADPATVEAPLGVNGMYWTWNQGYIFLAIDGRWDSNNDGQVGEGDQMLSYHPGRDSLYTPMVLQVHTDADQGGNVVLPLDLNIDTLMAGIDIQALPVSHDVSDHTVRLMHQLSTAITHVQ